jgi:hypothetical protein
MEQLSCTLTVDAELPAATVWGPGGAAAAEWIAEVEASEALRRATSATVATLEIRQSPV